MWEKEFLIFFTVFMTNPLIFKLQRPYERRIVDCWKEKWRYLLYISYSCTLCLWISLMSTGSAMWTWCLVCNKPLNPFTWTINYKHLYSPLHHTSSRTYEYQQSHPSIFSLLVRKKIWSPLCTIYFDEKD